MPEAAETCRICGSPNTRRMGEVEYLAGFRWTVRDCEDCGCRFTRHDETVHNSFHKESKIFYYDDYRVLAAECKKLFDQNDTEGLRSLLNCTAKYRFILDELSQLPRSAKMLEVGCSRGYLTSWFIRGGWDILGVDVSSEAVESARAEFGSHFVLAESSEIKARAPYDAIFHVGLIGCVNDPLALTRQCLSLLKPDGVLCFNAPNRAACVRKDQLWFDSTPPPDLVTLFPVGFWAKQFETEAIVREGVSYLDADHSFALHLKALMDGPWQPPVPQQKHHIPGPPPPTSVSLSARSRRWLMRIINKLARMTRLTRFVSCYPTEFGFFVKMRPKVQAPK